MNNTRICVPSQNTSPAYAVTASCPSCGGALIVRTRRDGSHFIGCTTYPKCTYITEYDPVLQELRNRITRAEAENALLRLQTKPTPPADLISRGVIDRELRRLGDIVLRNRFEAPEFAAGVTNAVLALRQLVQGGQA
jgi:ssDNA-binding Zn-finger/Zn-ribbon topoisomerase 1